MARKNYDKMYEEKKEVAAPAEEPVVESANAEPEVETAQPAKKEKVAEEIPAIKPFMASVTGGLNLNVRRTPGGEIIAVIPDGAQVRVLDEVDEWYRIESPKGFVMKKFIKKAKEK